MPRSSPGRPPFQGALSGRSLTVFNLALVVGLCAVAAYMLLEMRREAGARADLSARSLATILTRDVARNIELYDQAILSVVDGLRIPAVRNATPEVRDRSLFGRSGNVANFGGILAFDAQGDITLSSRPGGIFNARDRDYFRIHADRDDLGLFVGAPVRSRFSGVESLPLSRRMSNPDGSFAGVVGGAIQLEYFRQLFEAVHIRHGGTITLLSDDGTVIMRRPFAPGMIGQRFGDRQSFLRMKRGRAGGFRGPALQGDEIRSFTYAQVGDLPLRISIATPLEIIYDDWWRKAVTLGTVVLVLCGGILSLTWLLRRELRHRIAAEARTAQINVELQALAITDSLTGLWNRRRFDEVLARDVRRAVRQALPLALLMVDADHFKGFNDRYGHQCGDEVLKLIARSMAEVLVDRNATLFRIGGEEFAVILPETDLARAEIVAAQIRDAVATRAEPHETNPHRIVTVSIGGADLASLAIADPAILFEAADASLYEAKRMGRNTFSMTAPRAGKLRMAV